MPIDQGIANPNTYFHLPARLDRSAVPTENELVNRVAQLAIDIVFNATEATPALPTSSMLGLTASCYDHLKLLKAKLNTLAHLHSIGMCHGRVNKDYFFPPQNDETACRWRHADSTAFHQGEEFQLQRINDYFEAAAEHLPDAHKEALLEQTSVHHQLAELTLSLNDPFLHLQINFPERVEQVIDDAIARLQTEHKLVEDDQQRRSDLWLNGMQKATDKGVITYSHPTDPDYPQIKEWQISNHDREKINSLTQALNSELEGLKEAKHVNRVIAWTQFEQNNQQIIRAAYGTAR